jgi:hypothetical protein
MPAYTLSTLPSGEPLLLGRLVLARRPGCRPVLLVLAYCDRCRRSHQHGWPYPEEGLDHVTHRSAHCCNTRNPENEYRDDHVGLDPKHRKHNEKTLAEARRLLAAGRLAGHRRTTT